MSNQETRISPVRARAGFRGLHVLYVLIGGLGLSAIAWIVVQLLVY